MQTIQKADLFARTAMRKFPLADSVKAKPGQLSLTEMITRYPNKGVGMKVWRKTWPANSYWQVMHAEHRPQKNTKLYGVLYWDGELKSGAMDKIRGASKRGCW